MVLCDRIQPLLMGLYGGIMGHEWSEYQKNIFQHIQTSNQSLCVQAVAGASKTTVLVESSKLIPQNKSCLFLAFNKHIQEELTVKLPQHFTVKTLNGLGYGMLFYQSKVNKTECKLSEDKVDHILHKYHKNETVAVFRHVIRALVDYAKTFGIVPKKFQYTHRYLAPDTFETWMEALERKELLGDVKEEIDTQISCKNIAAHCQKEFSDKIYKDLFNMVTKILTESIEDEIRYDFADQLYIPFIKNLKTKKYDYIFADEIQDFSLVQLHLIKQISRPETTVIGVGDPQQSIYAFRGAYSNAMEVFKDMFKCKVLPLSICYRCSKTVVAEAQKWCSQIQPWDNSIDGTIKHIDNWTADTFGDNDFILSRYNAPLVQMGISLIKAHKPFQYTGRAFIQEIVSLIEKTKGHDIANFLEQINSYFDEKIALYTFLKKPHMVSDISDKKACIIAVAELFKRSDPKSSITLFLQKIFTKGSSGPILSTIFRAKGLEAENVFALDFDKLPPNLMIPSSDSKNFKEVKSTEENLVYIGITRAKKNLSYIKSKPSFRAKFYENKHADSKPPQV